MKDSFSRRTTSIPGIFAQNLGYIQSFSIQNRLDIVYHNFTFSYKPEFGASSFILH